MQYTCTRALSQALIKPTQVTTEIRGASSKKEVHDAIMIWLVALWLQPSFLLLEIEEIHEIFICKKVNFSGLENIHIYTPSPHSTFTLFVGVGPLSHQLKKSHLHEKFKINTLYEILIKNKQKSKLYSAKWRKSTCTIVIIRIHLHKMEINAWLRD